MDLGSGVRGPLLDSLSQLGPEGVRSHGAAVDCRLSRRGKLWYQHLTTEYVDVFDLFTVEEYRARNEERWSDGGNQKQFAVTDMEREVVERAKQKLGVTEMQLLHPSVMYKLLQFFWFGKASVRLLTEHADYRRLPPGGDDETLAGLPKEYVAYASTSVRHFPRHLRTGASPRTSSVP